MTSQTYNDGTGTYQPASMSDAEIARMAFEDGVFEAELWRRFPRLSGLRGAVDLAAEVAQQLWAEAHPDDEFDAMNIDPWTRDPVIGATWRRLWDYYRQQVRELDEQSA